MLFHLLLVAFAYFHTSACARTTPDVFRREYFNSPPSASSNLSIEAIVGIIAVGVAVFGIALPFLWPSLKRRLESCRQTYPRSICKLLPAIMKMSRRILTFLSGLKHTISQQSMAIRDATTLDRIPGGRWHRRCWNQPTTSRAFANNGAG
jgi:hypothetical protein